MVRSCSTGVITHPHGPSTEWSEAVDAQPPAHSTRASDRIAAEDRLTGLNASPMLDPGLAGSRHERQLYDPLLLFHRPPLAFDTTSVFLS